MFDVLRKKLAHSTRLTALVGQDFQPPFEVKESRDGLIVRVDVPGVREADLEIDLHGDRLFISGHREMDRHEPTETVHAWERGYGKFARTLPLPQNVDPASAWAELKHGVLTVVLPRAHETHVTRIAVKASAHA